MKKRNKNAYFLSVALVALIITTMSVSAIASASDPGDEEKNCPVRFENKKEIMATIDNNDFRAWQELIADKKIAEQITEENFAEFVQIHNLRKAGNHEEAKSLAEKLGLERLKHNFVRSIN